MLSILFDVGGVAGGAIAGILSDGTGAPACVSNAFVFGSVPCMWLYRRWEPRMMGHSAATLYAHMPPTTSPIGWLCVAGNFIE